MFSEFYREGIVFGSLESAFVLFLFYVELRWNGYLKHVEQVFLVHGVVCGWRRK